MVRLHRPTVQPYSPVRRAVQGARVPSLRDTWPWRDRDWVGALQGSRLAVTAIWISVFVCLVFYAQAFRHTYVDDTYITLQYARNLSEHLSWGFLPGRTTNTATSPLNVILLALTDRLLPGPTVYGVAWLTAAEWTLTLAVLLRLSRRLMGTPHFGLLATVGLVTNPLLLSGIGLEGYLFALLMLASLAMFVDDRPALLGLTLALLVLSRPDGALLVALILLLYPWGGWRSRARIVLVFGLTALPWYLFSWIHLGSVLPDTLLIKLNQTAWGQTTFANGLDLYRGRFEAATVASLWPIALAPFAILPVWRAGSTARRAVVALVAFAVVHYVAYAAMAVPPFHWYYTPEVTTLVVVGALGVAALLHGLAQATARADRWAALAATALPAAGLLYLAWVQGWPLRSAPIATNWGSPDQYRVVGRDVGRLVAPGDVVDLRGEIGTVAYYCRCSVVDVFADLDRSSELVADLRRGKSGVVAALLDVNFMWRTSQPALAPPAFVLDFDPVDRGEPAPVPPPEAVATWDVSSPWIRWTRITLRATAYLAIEVRTRAPDGSVLPPDQQPLLSGDYDVSQVAVRPDGQHVMGRWSDNRAEAIPVTPYSTVLVRVVHPDYEPYEVTMAVTTGTTRLVAELVPRPGP